MNVTSDLTFRVDVPGRGTATGQVSAEGTRLTVDTDDPVGVWDGAIGTAAAGNRMVATVAEGLREAGLSVTLRGPQGDVATAGAGVRSLLGRLVLGTSAISLGRPAALAPLARAKVTVWRRSHPVTIALTATVFAAGGVGGASWRRRHR